MTVLVQICLYLVSFADGDEGIMLGQINESLKSHGKFCVCRALQIKLYRCNAQINS